MGTRLIGSVEFRVPVYERIKPSVRVELVPYFDAGHSWNTDRDEFGEKTLMSVGLGTRAFVTDWGYVELFWGARLKDVSRIGQRDLQYDSVHFRIALEWP